MSNDIREADRAIASSLRLIARGDSSLGQHVRVFGDDCQRSFKSWLKVLTIASIVSTGILCNRDYRGSLFRINRMPATARASPSITHVVKP